MYAKKSTARLDSACVLFITTGLNTGGAETMLIKLLSRMDTQLFRPVVVSLTTDGTLGPKVRELGVELHALDMSSFKGLSTSLSRLFSIVKSCKPEILQGWMYHGNFAATLAKVFAKSDARLIWNVRHSLHDVSLEPVPLRSLIWLSARLFKHVNLCIYPSTAARRQHAAVGFDDAKAAVIPNGFDLKFFSTRTFDERKKYRRTLGLSDENVAVLHIARFHPMKDHIGFVRAAAEIAREMTEFRAVMAGAGVSKENRELMREIKAHGLGDRIILLGECRDVRSLYAAADLFCLSSAWGEAFPNVLGEAMAMGVVCTATNIGDSEFILGDCGTVVPPRDPHALAGGILRYLRMSQAERDEIGDRGRRRVLEYFSIDSIVKSYEECYLRNLSRSMVALNK